MFTQAQLTSALRWFLSTVGGIVAGYFAAKGWLTSDQVMAVFNSQTVLGLLTSLVMLGIGQWVRSPTNIIADADKVPGTTIVAPPAIANAIPSNTVVSSAEAKVVAK
jgi:hypothetical protein